MSGEDVARDTAKLAFITVLSRGTGFARVIAVTAVLGTTFLANTYQSANSVPNLLFELLAAGALQAGLVPVLVQLVDAGDDRRTGRLAGALLGLGCVVTGVGALAAAAGGRPLMSWFVRDVADASVRASQVRLGSFMLWIFAPQVVMYVANAVCTAALHARGRFLVPAAAPIVNNVVVISTYGTFAAMRAGAEPGLDLSAGEKWVLAGGTTLGVVAFCGWVVVAGVRAQPFLRPNLSISDPEVRTVLRSSSWVVGFVAVTQLLTLAMLGAVNGREGGVAVFSLAWVIFLLPYSLLVVPVVTTRFPRMARAALRPESFAGAVQPAMRAVVFCAGGASMLLVAVAPALAGLVVYGEAVGAKSEVASAIGAFAVGLVGYAGALMLTRASYAAGDTRLPFVTNLVVSGGAALAMAPVARSVAGPNVVAAVGLVHSVASVTVAGLLAVVVIRRPGSRVPGLRGGVVSASMAGQLVLAATLAVLGRVVVDRVLVGGSQGRLVDGVLVVVGTVVLGGTFLAGTAALGGPPPLEALATFGAGRDAQ